MGNTHIQYQAHYKISHLILEHVYFLPPVVDDPVEHCVGALCQWCCQRLLLSHLLLLLGGIDVLPCLVDFSIGCCH